MANITIRYKDKDGYTIKKLGQDRVTLGRASDCDLPLASDQISRQHCVLTRSEDIWSIEDLASANGTFVDGQRIQGSTPLKERSRIKIGNIRITFHYKERRQAKNGIELDPDELGADAAPQRNLGQDDPPEAMPCSACPAWFSIAHRLPGEKMPCPCCGHRNVVPRLLVPAST